MIPTVALTFDDGPSQWTPALLDVLAAHDAHATFFVLGENIHHGAILRRAVEEGHEIGVHGWDHTPADDLSADDLAADLQDTMLSIQLATSVNPKWWRPPWNRAGSSAAVAAENLGLGWCGVTLDGFDVSRDEDMIVSTVLHGLRDGAIIGLHDGIAANGELQVTDRLGTVRAADRILGECRSVTVSELLGRGGLVTATVGDWHLSEEGCDLLARLVEEHRPGTILECGSGHSTLALAAALRDVGSGHVVALEHHDGYWRTTRTMLWSAGLDDWADVRLAPLVDGWYHPAGWQDLREIGMLVVDGPPGSAGVHARAPALSLIREDLLPGTPVVLDDVDRDDLYGPELADLRARMTIVGDGRPRVGWWLSE